MDYVIAILVIAGIVFLIYHWIQYRKAVGKSEGYTKRRAVSLLFVGFISLIGISSIFADALFEFLGLERPLYFELISLATYTIFATATILVMRNKTPITENPENNHIEQTHTGDGDSQAHSGTGDNVGGDKIEVKGDYIAPSKKKENPKKLTFFQQIGDDEIIGREDELRTLHRLLHNNRKVVVVNGMGGIGKTTLATAYASRYFEEYKHIAWITRGEGTFGEDLLQNQKLLTYLAINPAGKELDFLVEEVLIALADLEGTPKLFVIDNATENLEEYLPKLPSQPEWHLLVTSRQKISGLEPLELDFLSMEKAKELFKKHCMLITDEAEIEALITGVDFHTLTIEILAKTAERQHLNAERLQEALKEDLKAGIKTAHRIDKVERVRSYLSSIFDLSELSDNEIKLLKNFIFLPPEFHAFELLNTLIAPPENELAGVFAGTIEGLYEKGWLIKEKKTGKFKMHAVIGEVVNSKFEIAPEDIPSLLDGMISLLSIDQSKDNPIDKFVWVPFGRLITGYFQDSFNEQISILQNNLALVLKNLGDYQSAKALLQKALTSNEKNFGEDHPTIAASYSNLALVLQDLGDYQGAKALLQKALTSNEQNFGEDHPTIAISYSNLASVLQDLGDYQGAKALLQKAVASDEKNFGEDHPTTAIRYSNLAIVLKDLGDYQGAKALLQKALTSNEQNFGEDHPTTAIRYSNLAIVLKDLGDYQGAKALLQKALTSNEQNFGEDHPTIAISYSNLASVLQDLGDYQGAKALLQKAVTSNEKNFGEDHPTTAIRYSNLASVLKDLGDYQGAKALLQKAVASDEKNFGEEHPTIAISYSNLATVLQDLGDYQGAKALLQKALTSNEKSFGEDHPTTAIRYSNLALVLQDLGDYQGAKALLQKALTSNEKNFGEDHPTTAISYSNLALVLKDLGDYQGALPFAKKAYEIFVQVLPEDHPHINIVKDNIESIEKQIKEE